MQVGDHLVTPRTGYTHHGLYIGNQEVIHYDGKFGSDSGRITKVTLAEFCEGASCRVRDYPLRVYGRKESVERASQRLGESDYNLVLNNCEQFVAWFEPEHRIVRLATPFFEKRFAGMDWSILTPYECAHRDGTRLHFTAGVSRSSAPDEDALDDLWRTYYRNIFNPARVKISAMQSEMPKKYWRNMPETQAIPGMLRAARGRTAAMTVFRRRWNFHASKSPRSCTHCRAGPGRAGRAAERARKGRLEEGGEASPGPGAQATTSAPSDATTAPSRKSV